HLEACAQEAETYLDLLRSRPVPRLFDGAAIGFIAMTVFAAVTAAGAWIANWQLNSTLVLGATVGVVAAILVVALLHRIARKQTAVLHMNIVARAAAGEALHHRARQFAHAKRDRWDRRLIEERDRDHAAAKTKYEGMLADLEKKVSAERDRVAGEWPERIEQRRRERSTRLETLDTEHAEQRADLESRRDEERQTQIDDATAAERELDAELTTTWDDLANRWSTTWSATRQMIDASQQALETHFPAWNDSSWTEWQPRHEFEPALPFGHLDFDLDHVEGGLPGHDRLKSTQVCSTFSVPAAIRFPDEASLFIEAGLRGRDTAVGAVQNYMMRLLTSAPPGKVRFLILDPVGLGRNFAGFMHLADHDEALVGGRIWTEPRHIEQRLLDLTEHMEHVIQKYLRNEFESISAYNERAGAVAEPYRVLVACDFPVNFSEAAARRLTSLASSGPRCGVHSIIVRDVRQPLPTGCSLDDLRLNAQHIREVPRRRSATQEQSQRHSRTPDESTPVDGSSRSTAAPVRTDQAGSGLLHADAPNESESKTGRGSSIFDVDLMADLRSRPSKSEPACLPTSLQTTASETSTTSTASVLSESTRTFAVNPAEMNPGPTFEATHASQASDTEHGTTSSSDSITSAIQNIGAGPASGTDITSESTDPAGMAAPNADEVPTGEEPIRFIWQHPDFEALHLHFEQPPDEQRSTTLLHRIGESSRDATRVEVAFDVIAPADERDELWSRTCDRELAIPLGRAGATRLQSITLGRGTNQHVLIAGKTGSGKSTLLHVLITNLSLWYAPDEVEFYLVDFKKGVEFKTYATHDLLHARAIAVESDREFGVSVLHRVDDELKRRGELFREHGVQDLAAYRRRRTDDDPQIPRTLLIIDEFQEF
ncbi:MAG: FtsK/SpoIIIE domain-containing protein, partial [Planctomycetota bacterium]